MEREISKSGLVLPFWQSFSYSLQLLNAALSPVALIALFLLSGVSLRLKRWRTLDR